MEVWLFWAPKFFKATCSNGKLPTVALSINKTSRFVTCVCLALKMRQQLTPTDPQMTFHIRICLIATKQSRKCADPGGGGGVDMSPRYRQGLISSYTSYTEKQFESCTAILQNYVV